MPEPLHTITWDHTGCDHPEDGDDIYSWCSPAGTVTCLATPDTPVADAMCANACDHCDEYALCDNGCDYCHPDAPNRTGPAPHCMNCGRPLRYRQPCNAVDWIDAEGSDVLGPQDHVGDWTDGPIEVEWTGDGYVWWYPDA